MITMIFDLCSSLNVTAQLEDNETSVLNFHVIDCYLKTVVDPLICSTGFIVNAFCLLLFLIVNFRHKSAHSEMLPYLAGLCFFDATQNILTITVLDVQAWAAHLQYRYPFYPDHWVGLKSFSSYCVRYLGPIIYTVNFASIWTITAIAIERHRAICNPWTSLHKQSNMSEINAHRNHSWLLVIAIFVVALLLNSIRWWESEITPMSLQTYYEISEIPVEVWSNYVGIGFQPEATFYDVFPTELSKDPTYSLMMNKVVYASLVYGLPLLILTILNVRILWALYMVPVEAHRESSRRHKEKSPKPLKKPRLPQMGGIMPMKSKMYEPSMTERSMTTPNITLSVPSNTGVSTTSLTSIAPTPTKRKSSVSSHLFRNRHREMRSAWMLITIIALFFMCHTGGLLIRFIDREWIEANQSMYYTIVDINNLLFNINSLLNPVVYFLFTKQFKDFWKLSFGPPSDAIKRSANGIAHAAVMTLLVGQGSLSGPSDLGAPKRSVILRKLNSDHSSTSRDRTQSDCAPFTPPYRHGTSMIQRRPDITGSYASMEIQPKKSTTDQLEVPSDSVRNSRRHIKDLTRISQDSSLDVPCAGGRTSVTVAVKAQLHTVVSNGQMNGCPTITTTSSVYVSRTQPLMMPQTNGDVNGQSLRRDEDAVDSACVV